jgi:hypothetical protein
MNQYSSNQIIKAILLCNPQAEATIYETNGKKRIEFAPNTDPIPEAEIELKIDQAKFEIAIEEMRIERNQKLVETDFYALIDSTLSDEMKKYRQELRDITQDLATESDVNSAVWPTQPLPR